MNMMKPRWILTVMAASATASLAGCSTYTTPGKPADFVALDLAPEQAKAMTEPDIAARMDRKPAATFPASIAFARVQDSGYRSYTYSGSSSDGAFSLVSVRDVETPEALAKLERLPMIRGFGPLNRFVVSGTRNIRDLRNAAAELQADMLLVYTFDTRFGEHKTVPALGVITLGLFPDTEARVTSTVSTALIDTRTGYIYGVTETTAREESLANVWTSGDAIDKSRRAAESRAFSDAVTEFERLWSNVVRQYGPAPIKLQDAPAPSK